MSAELGSYCYHLGYEGRSADSVRCSICCGLQWTFLVLIGNGAALERRHGSDHSLPYCVTTYLFLMWTWLRYVVFVFEYRHQSIASLLLAFVSPLADLNNERRGDVTLLEVPIKLSKSRPSHTFLHYNQSHQLQLRRNTRSRKNLSYFMVWPKSGPQILTSR